MIKDIKMTADGEAERCFILKDDVAATVVIPFRKLLPIDYQRLKAIQAKGGEMLRVMRDENLDNGRNALKQYEPLFEVVYKVREPKTSTEESASDERGSKRGPGRPRGSRNKKASSKSGGDES